MRGALSAAVCARTAAERTLDEERTKWSEEKETLVRNADEKEKENNEMKQVCLNGSIVISISEVMVTVMLV